ncbi:hypothetical protein EV11_0549 [Prochlorococcus sp. SS52]|nr:hypothetical protein EV04_1219 [Prochlorococcus marinus str. LG]KGG21484.1 hypothetical protein EV08_0569 [Prochlorococcus marinus str. SS2]KGG23171.1 hypothetical protein EV09_1919 [Prochlorococcus marinus str. SS35]KGG33882.1 hypothetical protein EV10_0321 [Prochlorococcus marinus str. SS51]KGG36769.1 hypothetical protein EV11_0549 [Prochlorococcus sp. SS52]
MSCTLTPSFNAIKELPSSRKRTDKKKHADVKNPTPQACQAGN